MILSIVLVKKKGMGLEFVTSYTAQPHDISARKRWLSIICLAFAAFIFNTTEFAPIALLTDIASDLGLTEAKAGTMITIYAWFVAIFSLPLLLLCAKAERRKLLAVLFLVFTVSHLVSGMAGNFDVLLLSRLGIAAAHAVFWSITVPLAVRIAPAGGKAKALSLMATGSSLAMILGVPLGRTIGLLFGWRVTFLTIAALAMVCCVILLKMLPPLPAEKTGTWKSLSVLWHNKPLVWLYVMTVTLVTAHFTAYSYIEPFLLQVAHFSDTSATVALLLFGIAGIVASWFYARSTEGGVLRNVFWPVLIITISLFAFRTISWFPDYPLFLVMVWGMGIMLFGLNMQEQVIRFGADATDVAMSIYSAIFNVGIGGGAFLGGIVISQLELSSVGWIGGLIALGGIVFYFMLERSLVSRKK